MLKQLRKIDFSNPEQNSEKKERNKASRKRISLIGTLFNWEFILSRDISSRSNLTTWSEVQQVAVATGCQIERVRSVRPSFVFPPSYLFFSSRPFFLPSTFPS